MSYGDIELDKHGLGNGLFPEGTMPLPKPLLNYHLKYFVLST